MFHLKHYRRRDSGKLPSEARVGDR
jgi:hypothetical protein